MDKRNYLIANKLVGNRDNEAVIEFAYQGPIIKVEDGSVNFAISGDIPIGSPSSFLPTTSKKLLMLIQRLIQRMI